MQRAKNVYGPYEWRTVLAQGTLGEPFQLREGQWIGAKVGTFCTRPSIKRNDGGWADVDWFRISK